MFVCVCVFERMQLVVWLGVGVCLIVCVECVCVCGGLYVCVFECLLVCLLVGW